MKKRFLVIFTTSLLTWVNIYAADDKENKTVEEKKISYSAALDAGSTYLWRGFDAYAGKLVAGNTPGNVFNFAPGLFPSFTVNSTNGLSFNIWGARSVIARSLKDGDLGSIDEIDFTGTYTVEDKSGTFASSIIGYVFPTASYASGTTATLPSYGELVFSYTAPIILSPFVSIAASLGPSGGEYEYASLGISHVFEMGVIKLGPKLLMGYWYMNNSTSNNKLHIDLNVPVIVQITEAFEFHAGLIGSYRAIGFVDNVNKYSPFILVASLGTSYSF